MHLPGHNFTGPGTQLKKKGLTQIKLRRSGVNPLIA